MKTQFVKTRESNSHILLELPHSGTIGLSSLRGVPSIIADNLRATPSVKKTIHFGCDHAVPLMTDFPRLAKDLDLNFLINRFARGLTDVNRAEHEVSGYALDGKALDQSNAGVLLGRTVPFGVDFSSPERRDIQARSMFQSMFTRPFTQAEYEEVLDLVYRPYHAALNNHHERIRDIHGRCFHLSLHSLPPAHVALVDGGYVFGGMAKRGPIDLEHGQLPDVILIHNEFKSADSELIASVRSAFEKHGLIVSDGTGPFAGSNGVTGMYGCPENGIEVLGIEHVTHGIEIDRHQGGVRIVERTAKTMQKAYREMVENLIRL